MRVDRRTFLAGSSTLLTAIAGCAGRETTTTTTTTPTTTSTDGRPSFTDRFLPIPQTPEGLREAVVSGGVPKDGIPSIDDPMFESADQVGDRLADHDYVFGIEHNGDAKAYPRQILVWHEICNDTVGDTPFSVTYCPLTGTALAFHRGSTTFGVSGRLLNDNLIMYDRGTEQWWPQVLATNIPSDWHDQPYTRRTLSDRRLTWTTWNHWRTTHPTTQVLTRDTGYIRNYDEDPYGTYQPDRRQYYSPDSEPLFPPLDYDPRYLPKRVVLGARTAAGAVAFRKDAVRDHRLLEGMLGDIPVIAVYDPTLDTGYIYKNPMQRSFTVEATGTLSSNGTQYQPDNLPLTPVHTFDAMWFAWSGFYPKTNTYD